MYSLVSAIANADASTSSLSASLAGRGKSHSSIGAVSRSAAWRSCDLPKNATRRFVTKSCISNVENSVRENSWSGVVSSAEAMKSLRY